MLIGVKPGRSKRRWLVAWLVLVMVTGATLTLMPERSAAKDEIPQQPCSIGASKFGYPVTGCAQTDTIIYTIPLSLSLSSSRAFCTANTLTELSWTITGGQPPYTLTVAGETVDVSAESHRVNCGPLTLDPLTGEPLPNQTKAFSASVTDARGVSASAEATVALGALPSAPTLTAQTAASGSVLLSWSAGPASAIRWDYRQQQEGGDWGVWTEIAGADAATVSHSVSGLTEDTRYHFQLRVSNFNGAGLTSETVSAVAGLTPTVPSDRETLYYDVLDSAGEATESGAYAFLTDADDLTSGTTTFAEASGAAALLLNSSGYVGRDYTDVHASVQVGDQITWFPYSGCWYHYRVTEILADPPTPARKLFRISLKTEDPCGFTTTQENDPKYFDDARDNIAAFGWDNPPSEPEVGSDGLRILPYRYAVDGGHTYRLTAGRPTSIVIDVPTGMRLIDGGYMIASGPWGSVLSATYFDETSGGTLWLDPGTGESASYYVPTPEGETNPPADVVARFRALIASIREQALPE